MSKSCMLLYPGASNEPTPMKHVEETLHEAYPWARRAGLHSLPPFLLALHNYKQPWEVFSGLAVEKSVSSILSSLTCTLPLSLPSQHALSS